MPAPCWAQHGSQAVCHLTTLRSTASPPLCLLPHDSATVMMFLVFQPGVDTNDPDAIASWNKQLTIIMVAGLLPVASLAVLAAYLRTRYYVVVVANKFK